MDKSVFLAKRYLETFAMFSKENLTSEDAKKAGRLEMLIFNAFFRGMEIPKAFPSTISTSETPRHVQFLAPFARAVQ